jgi:redox-sensitive bicupin YhaK (pirin superfamily)
MGDARRIRKVFHARLTVEGAGVRLRRVFGHPQVPQFDPFLLLDHFGSDNPDDYVAGFPWHPHRGMETITYMLQGEVEHGDSIGNAGVIAAGDVQWMTAGSGIVHQEMPRQGRNGGMRGFQLWGNIPASHKMMPPRYRDIRAEQIPQAQFADGATIKVICGEVNGERGPVRDIVTDPEYLDVSVAANGCFRHRVKRGHTAFAYVFDGRALFQPDRDPYSFEQEGGSYCDMGRDGAIAAGSAVLFEDGDELVVAADDEPVRFLLISGSPLGEPVAWRGPIVMNTQADLRRAFDEYREGTFLKHGK